MKLFLRLTMWPMGLLSSVRPTSSLYINMNAFLNADRFLVQYRFI